MAVLSRLSPASCGVSVYLVYPVYAVCVLPCDVAALPVGGQSCACGAGGVCLAPRLAACTYVRIRWRRARIVSVSYAMCATVVVGVGILGAPGARSACRWRVFRLSVPF